MFGRGTSFYRWNTILADLGFKFKEEIVWNKKFNSSPVLPIQRFHETISIHTKGKGIINHTKVPYCEQKQYNIDSIAGDIMRIKSALNNTTELDALKLFLETKIKQIYKRKNDKGSGCTIAKNSTGVFNIPAFVLSAIIDGTREKSIIECVYDRYSRIHPTQKPVRLLERLLNLVSREGDTALDPFSGSASTAVAALNTGRNFIGFEIDTEYYQLSQKRVKTAMEQRLNRLFN
jgi:site-specific DNA-methyltransferase (adenine-specific)